VSGFEKQLGSPSQTERAQRVRVNGLGVEVRRGAAEGPVSETGAARRPPAPGDRRAQRNTLRTGARRNKILDGPRPDLLSGCAFGGMLPPGNRCAPPRRETPQKRHVDPRVPAEGPSSSDQAHFETPYRDTANLYSLLYLYPTFRENPC